MRRIIHALLAGVVLSTACVARADMINLAYQYVDAGGTMSATYNGTYYGQGLNWANGLQKFATTSPVGPLASQIGSSAWALCCDIQRESTFSSTPYTVNLLQTVEGQAQSDMARQLWAKHYSHAWESSTPIYYGGNQGGFVSGQPAATPENIQTLSVTYALLEIVYDFDGTLASLDVSAGLFRMSAGSDTVPPSVAAVQAMLGTLVLPSQYQGPMPVLLELTSPTYQNVVLEIPEPATLGLLVLGGLSVLRRGR